MTTDKHKQRIKTIFWIVSGTLLITGLAWFFAEPLYLFFHKQRLNMQHITDPADSAFKIEDFNPKHYVYQEDLGEAFRKIFSRGTTRNEIDRLLLSKPGVIAEVDKGDRVNDEIIIIYFVPKFKSPYAESYPGTACYSALGKTHWRYIFRFHAAEEANDKLTLEKIDWVFC